MSVWYAAIAQLVFTLQSAERRRYGCTMLLCLSKHLWRLYYKCQLPLPSRVQCYLRYCSLIWHLSCHALGFIQVTPSLTVDTLKSTIFLNSLFQLSLWGFSYSSCRFIRLWLPTIHNLISHTCLHLCNGVYYSISIYYYCCISELLLMCLLPFSRGLSSVSMIPGLPPTFVL